MNIRKRASFVAITVCLAVIALVVVKTMGQEESEPGR